MAVIMEKSEVLLVLVGLLVIASQSVHASDPDLTTDLGINSTNPYDFVFTGFRNLKPGSAGVATPNFADFTKLPGLTGLGLTAVLFEFGPQSQVNPHTHPRGTELFYVLTGTIDVGFVDTNNTLFEVTLWAGDLFVFPKGLLHFQRNNGWQGASGYSVLSSENPGILQVNNALFTASGTGLPDNVLAAAFGIDEGYVKSLKSSVLKATPASAAPASEAPAPAPATPSSPWRR